MRLRLLLKMQLPLPGELPGTLCWDLPSSRAACAPLGRLAAGSRAGRAPWGPRQLRAQAAVPGARRRSAEMSHRPPGALTRKRR